MFSVSRLNFKIIITQAFSTFLVLSLLAFIYAINSKAEGSRQLISSGGYRPYTEVWSTGSSAGILRKTTIYVYATVGETINLGSSAAGIGSGTINRTSPTGAASTCGSSGLIANLSQELAGPLPNAGGFTPCTVTVASGQEGVWKIDFVPPNAASNTNPPTTTVGSSWTQPNNVGYISAWDVTVRNSGGSEIKGRTFANYLAMNTGGNNIGVSSLVYVQTKDGYTYRIDLNNIDPFGFIMFSNNRGVIDNSTGTQFYKSLQLTGTNLPSGYNIHKPDQADTTTDFTNKIFFEQPASDLPVSTSSAGGTVWLKNVPQPPAAISGFSFTGVDGTTSQGGTSPLGGNFSFTSDRAGEADITLDLNQNGIYGDGNDRTVTGIVSAGSNQLFWNGLDGNGNAVPAGTQTYTANIVGKVGEVHFPFIDAENNPNGLIITRLSDSSNTVYFNDSNLAGGTDQRIGISSGSGAHTWNSSFGDGRLIDTWSVVKSTPVTLQNSITLREADLSITKTHSPASPTAGGNITYTVTVTNSVASPNDSPLSRVVDNVPAYITGVNWTCAITNNAGGPGTNSCAANSGSGNNLNTFVSLNPGAAATFTITGQILSSFSGNLSNTATVAHGTDTNDPVTANNTATDTVTIAANTNPQANLSLTKTSCPTLVSGQICNYTLTTTNNGPVYASPVTLTDTLPSRLIYVSYSDPNNDGWSCNNSGQTVTCTNSNIIPNGASKSVILRVLVT